MARVDGAWAIDNRADRLRRAAGLGVEDVDDGAALSIAMAGYTVDRATLYRGLLMPGPGECLVASGEGGPERQRYHTYRPWRVVEADERALKRRLADVTLAVMEKHLASLDGRPLVIPLSAGNNSRLVASAARHLGYRNIRCFSYGRPGNFEAAGQPRHRRAPGRAMGLRAAVDRRPARAFSPATAMPPISTTPTRCASVPFVQDMSAIEALKANGFIPADAVIANGNSGDYISGNHIPAKLCSPPQGLSEAARRSRIVDALTDKHFALWLSLRTEKNLARIRTLLARSIAAIPLGAPETDHGLYEYAEFQDRQCKYVITGQRIYEFLGHDWRLPLWDNDYLDFWESVPLRFKAGQRLYNAMLRDANWGGVWRDIPVNSKSIRPRWLVPLRLAAKIAHAPLGAERWHRFERRVFQYWMDATCNAAGTPYSRVLSDGRGARHARRLAGGGLSRAPWPWSRPPAGFRSMPELFTPAAYRDLLESLLARGYSVRGYADADPGQRHLILRHDIDMSLDAALPIAEIENALGLKAHYFVLAAHRNVQCVLRRRPRRPAPAWPARPRHRPASRCVPLRQ